MKRRAKQWFAALVGVGCLSCDAVESEVADSGSGVTTAAAVTSADRVAVAAAPTPPASDTPEPPPDAVAAQHILITYRGAKRAPKDVTRSKAEAKKLAEEVLQKANTGADFTRLVNDHSEDEGSRERLGSLGKFQRGVMDPRFEEAAFALRVDQVSAVVETPFGFHIIKRNQ